MSSSALSTSVSSIGGGASSFFPAPSPAAYHSNYIRTPNSVYHYHIADGSTPSPYPAFHPAFGPYPYNRLTTDEMIQSCATHAARIQQAHKADRYGISPTLPDGSQLAEKSRRGALFCRSGSWLEILDEPPASDDDKGDPPERVRGTKAENSKFSILEFISVAIGLVSIKGVESQRYLCMDGQGSLYAASGQNYSSECVFLEEMLENYYNLYSSCKYGHPRKPWYVALRRTGRSRNGRYARRRRKASHFLVVHYDEPPPPKTDPPKNGAPYDLAQLLGASLKHRPPSSGDFRNPLEHARRISARTFGIEKVDAKVVTDKDAAAEEARKLRKKKRRREHRLHKEQRRRRQRKQELERLREEEERQRQERLQQNHGSQQSPETDPLASTKSPFVLMHHHRGVSTDSTVQERRQPPPRPQQAVSSYRIPDGRTDYRNLDGRTDYRNPAVRSDYRTPDSRQDPRWATQQQPSQTFRVALQPGRADPRYAAAQPARSAAPIQPRHPANNNGYSNQQRPSNGPAAPQLYRSQSATTPSYGQTYRTLTPTYYPPPNPTPPPSAPRPQYPQQKPHTRTQSLAQPQQYHYSQYAHRPQV